MLPLTPKGGLKKAERPFSIALHLKKYVYAGNFRTHSLIHGEREQLKRRKRYQQFSLSLCDVMGCKICFVDVT